MPLVYCDQNFVVTAHDGSEDYKAQLRSLAAGGVARLVLSPWHWQEMAQDQSHERGTSVADFCDSLDPSWLYDRISIQRKEISHSLYRFVGIEAEVPVMVGAVRDVIHDLTGKWVERASRSMVAHLRKEGGASGLMDEILNKGFQNNQKNIAHSRAGYASPQLLKQAERKYVELLLPLVTPSGLTIDDSTKRQFLDAVQISDLPAVAIEMETMKDRWSSGRQLKPNDALDQQHTMALPYVDFFITNDKGLRKIIERVVAAIPVHTATLLNKEEFDSQFL
jgi:hypothetical protein